MKPLNWMPRKPSTVTCLMMLLNCLLILGLFSSTAFTEAPQLDIPHPPDPIQDEVTQGALRVKVNDEVVECPLKHTDVKVNISGFIARATVTQTFFNPYEENIEAVYVFPLPHTAAVDAMTMHIGDRKIVGLMKRRAEARAVYERALQQGQTASLLEQERPNIFTQSVGNIKPRQEIQIEISYVDVLNYDMGTYEFHFPMVVGPRYIPGAPISKIPELPKELKGKVGEIGSPWIEKVTLGPDPSGTGWAPDTNRVPDASRITPPVLKPGYRTGHDIRLSVSLDAGVPVQDIEIVNHAANLERIDTSKAKVEIVPTDSIPNKDFVMKYAVAGEKPEMAVFTHATGPEQRYFMLMVQPKLDAELAKAPPRELVFLIDVSGSMSHEPIAKVKAAMRHFFALSKPSDTFQIITFSDQPKKLFENSVPATEANVARARTFIQAIQGSGGTEMLAGVKTVLNAPVDPDRVRIVVMFTDGFIGNEAEIIAEVGRRAGDQIRFWVVGIGSSPNRFLIDGVAKEGGGMSGVLDLNTNPKPLVAQIVARIHRAQLANIQMDWKQFPVYETYPRRIPELWAGRPLIVYGRYAAGGQTEIEISGTAEGKPLTYRLDVTLPDVEPTHAVLAKVWARRKIADLSAQTYAADIPEVVEEITRIALDYRLMSQYTSFVAVDESEIPLADQQATPPRRVVVPVPIPEGVDFQGVFGHNNRFGLEEEPQFFYDLFGKELLEGNEVYSYIEEKEFDQTGALVVGSTGQFDRRRIEKNFPSYGSGYGSPNGLPRHIESERLVGFRAQASPPGMHFQYVPLQSLPDAEAQQPSKKMRATYRTQFTDSVGDDESQQQPTAAQEALAAAQALQKQGHLEAARLRYQHALALAVDDTRIDGTAMQAIWTLSAEIAKERAEVHPGLNRKLDLILRNQPLADAIRILVTVGEFQLNLVPGSLKDVASLLNVQEELRVTYLDLRRATVVQGLEWLLAPYHLTWHVKAPDTITIGTARRLPGASVWGYNVRDLAMPLAREFDEDVPRKTGENALRDFRKAIRTVINQKEEGIQPGSAVLLDARRLLVYGDPEIHRKVERFLEALREGESDVTSIARRRLSEDEAAALKALQKLTMDRWQTRAEARETHAEEKEQRWIIGELATASLALFSEALDGKVDLESLTRLQMAWEDPHLKSIVEGEYLYVATRSAWCIRTAAQLVPTDAELSAFSQSVISQVKRIRTLTSPREDSFAAYLGTLYALLALTAEVRPDDAMRALIKEQTVEGLIAQGLLSPSEESDKALATVLASQEIIGNEDLLLLTCLIAKRRGGHLWQTFREELPYIARRSQLRGPLLVILSRLQALNTEI